MPVSVYQTLLTVEGLRAGIGIIRENQPVAPVTDDIINATLPNLPQVVADMVRLHRATGMRPGELVSIRPGDVDRTLDVWRYEPSWHKIHCKSAISPRSETCRDCTS
ncbi:MAG: hypothetical protein KDA41_06865 [Planctomycetales bacterium]|nr:hypothetical protein [Planctomycetales bacterium]